MVEALGTGFTMGTGCALLERKQDSGAHVEAAVPRKEKAREAEEGEGKRAGRGRTRHQASTMSLDDGREDARAWIPQQAAGDRKSDGVSSSLKTGPEGPHCEMGLHARTGASTRETQPFLP